MRQCAKVYFQLKMEIQNGQKKVQQGTEGSNSTLSHLWGPLYITANINNILCCKITNEPEADAPTTNKTIKSFALLDL